MVLGEFFCILWLVKTMFLKFVEFWWKSIIHDKTILWIVFSPIIKMVNIVRNTQDGTNIQLFFYKQLRSGLSLKSCFYFQGFWGSKLLNGCLVFWAMFARNAAIFRLQNGYLWSVILNFSQKYYRSKWILVHWRFSSYFTLITKEKLHFSLICCFYCCLVKWGRALKVAYQFAIRGLVAYKQIAYKTN